MALNVTTAVFRPGFNIATASPSLVQWDQGQVLKFEGVELPSAYQVEFTNAVTVQAITMIGNENGVEIPNELLQQSFPINAYIVLHETAEDRETEYWATIYVKARQKPREETPDPEQSSVIDQTIAALQEGVAEAQAAADEAEAASQAVQDMGVEAETLPEESAATVEKTVDPETGVVTLTFGIPKGAKGNKGDKGNPGETYLLAPSVDTIVKNPNTGTFIPAQIVFTVYKVVNGTSSPYRAAAIVADIFGSGMVPHYEVVNDYRLTVPINSIADTGYVACSAYGNGGIIATITIPCILDGAKGDPGEGVAPNGTTGQFLKKKSGEDYDTEWADVDPGVTSVNGKTGAVTLTASDVGAKPASYEAPVSSVNEKTGAVVLDAGDIGYESTTVEDELGTINSALTSLSAVTEIIDTASGAIASFPDGSGLPMRSLVAEINPVQDLHGYDSPWPDGGGKNKLAPWVTTQTNRGVTWTANADGTFTSSGTATDNPSQIVSGNFNLPVGEYIISGCPSGGSSSTYFLRILRYDGNTLLGDASDYGSGKTFTIDGTETHCKVFVSVNTGLTAPSGVWKPMIRLSSVTDATYAPYSNICPISGWTGLQGQRTGVNLFDKDATWTSAGNYILNDNGVQVSDGSSSYFLEKLLVKPNTTFYSVGGASDNGVQRIYYYDINGDFISRSSAQNYGFSFTTPSNCYYIGFQYKASALNLSAWSINYPSTDTSYHAYTGEAISVTFPTTVYGGTDEVISGNGTSTMGMVDLGNLAWTLLDANKHLFRSESIPTLKQSTSASQIPNLLSDRYKTVGASTVYNAGQDCIISQGIAGIVGAEYIMVVDKAYSDATSFKNAVTGSVAVYELATPQTFTHEGQSVDTLVGQNNVFVDTGDVSVTYQASIKGYIDKVLGS